MSYVSDFLFSTLVLFLSFLSISLFMIINLSIFLTAHKESKK